MTLVGLLLIAVGTVGVTVCAAWWIAHWSDYVDTRRTAPDPLAEAKARHPSNGSHVRVIHTSPYDWADGDDAA